MRIPFEIIIAPVAGGIFVEVDQFSGEYWKGGKLLATWTRSSRNGVLVHWEAEGLAEIERAQQEAKERV